MEEKVKEVTYFRIPDMMTIASEEEQHAITDSAEFELTLTGVILDYDDIVLCECRYPNYGDDNICIACGKSLDGARKIRFWKLVPNMQEVDLEIRPLSLGPTESDQESPEQEAYIILEDEAEVTYEIIEPINPHQDKDLTRDLYEE